MNDRKNGEMSGRGTDDGSRLRELILNDLDGEERRLFEQVHSLDGACAILGYLDEHRNEVLTADDLAFHSQEPPPIAATAVRGLIALGLLRRVDAQGMTFFGLVAEPSRRERVHKLFNWQRGWRSRLALIENLVDGRLAQ